MTEAEMRALRARLELILDDSDSIAEVYTGDDLDPHELMVTMTDGESFALSIEPV